jgi:DMSO/TMAO reductase YedYZ molybdopterin-dependent catalytic subunit
MKASAPIALVAHVQGRFTSRLHHEKVASWLGVWLGISFTTAFVTGLVSHFMQHPPGWLQWPSHPVDLYRVTQGLHVITGFATIPLLLAKLWTVYPKLWQWPPFRTIGHAISRAMVFLLVGGAIFELATGLFNVAYWYPFPFFFTVAHYWTAYIVFGALLIHIANEAATVRRNVRLPSLTSPSAMRSPSRSRRRPTPKPAGPGDPVDATPEQTPGRSYRPAAYVPADKRVAGLSQADEAVAPGSGPAGAEGLSGFGRFGSVSDVDASGDSSLGAETDRRRFLGVVAAACGAVALTTVGEAFSPLAKLAVFAPRRPGVGPQRLPVNTSAAAAQVTSVASDPGWRLSVTGRVERELALSLADLRAMPRAVARLPIACVEGWSADATWAGVRLRDVLRLAGVADGARVLVESLEAGGNYRTSKVDPGHWHDPLTLLALDLNGSPLDLDHGYPCRLIAPDRPGVLQTKWLGRVVVS